MEGYPVMQFVGYRVPTNQTLAPVRPRLKKYVFLCTVCGGLATLLGGLFLGVYLILRTYTSSLNHFETIPTYIPAVMLLLTGLGIMCLARRKNRYAVLIKLCGVCCLVCAATCVLVTVTTTVIHMSRLQSLRECVYTIKTQTCTCYSNLLEGANERTEEGAHYVFNSTPDCEVIHGALYSCLRAMFGLSVIGILVCIFCCMLVYQLLSHERKKMYWEQLELRCRYLYGQPRNQQVITPPQRCSHCACSQQFRYPVEGTFENRLWAGGRIGNLYSPNPVGDEPQQSSGWAWRLPWSRSDPQTTQNREPMTYNQAISCTSPDSQYGFSAQGVATVSSATSASYTMIEGPPTQVYQWGPPPPYSDPNSPRRACTSTVNCAVQDDRNNHSRSMSSSSGKSEIRNEQIVSPRVKYLRQTIGKRNEPSESEVYFADVSSCCNGSVRNDSLLYDEPLTPDLKQGPSRKDTPLKQPRFVQENKIFQKIPEERTSTDSEIAHNSSEEDDPEIISYNERIDLSRPPRSRLQTQGYPSPMSISSPSSKDFMETSENGSADSVWSGCSPDFLAPDAQYETIPEQRLRNDIKRRGLQEWHNYQDIANLNSKKMKEKYENSENFQSTSRTDNYIVEEQYNELPRHHYEEIRESVNRSTQDFCLNKKDLLTNSVDSPKLFEKRLFSGSPECIALVDESQCSHNDSSCRCSLSLSKCEDSNH